nr:hypothetical protein [Mesorhizobium sp.]
MLMEGQKVFVQSGQGKKGLEVRNIHLLSQMRCSTEIAPQTKKKPAAGRRWQRALFRMRRGRRCAPLSVGHIWEE